MKLIHGMTPVEFDSLIARKYRNKISDAQSRGLEFSLSLMDFRRLHTRKRCQYTNLPLELSRQENGKLNNNSLTLERVDNSQGYVKGNVISVCKAANGIKSVFENPSNALNVEQAILMFRNIDLISRKKELTDKLHAV